MFSILFALLAMVVLVCILLFYDHLQKVRAAMFDALASVSYLGHSMTEGQILETAEDRTKSEAGVRITE